MNKWQTLTDMEVNEGEVKKTQYEYIHILINITYRINPINFKLLFGVVDSRSRCGRVM